MLTKGLAKKVTISVKGLTIEKNINALLTWIGQT